jgi:hypothetical protein
MKINKFINVFIQWWYFKLIFYACSAFPCEFCSMSLKTPTEAASHQAVCGGGQSNTWYTVLSSSRYLPHTHLRQGGTGPWGVGKYLRRSSTSGGGGEMGKKNWWVVATYTHRWRKYDKKKMKWGKKIKIIVLSRGQRVSVRYYIYF